MSKLVETLVWNSDAITDKTELLVMLVIADAANDDGVGMPTQEAIAQGCRSSKRTVQRALKKLKERGLVSWTDKRTDDSPRNLYQINIQALTTASKCRCGTASKCRCASPDHGDKMSLCINSIYIHTTKEGKYGKNGSAHQNQKSTLPGARSQAKITPLIASVETPKTDGRAPRKSRFKPPSLQDVRAFAAAQNLTDHAEPFIDYYEANGWVQGKALKPLKSWEAAYRQWCRREKEYRKASGHDIDPQPARPFGSGYKLQPFK